MTLVRKDPRLGRMVRLRPKASDPAGVFGSRRRQTMFCNRVAGVSQPSYAVPKTPLMRRAILPFLAVLLFLPTLAFAQTKPVDLTSIFIDGGITIDRLLVYQISDIVLIRGRTDDPAQAAEAGRFAVSHGYRRVANLIEIVPAIGNTGIENIARRQLEMSPQLAGCSFRVDSSDGILRVRGQVSDEIQKGFAIRLLSRIEGVRQVRATLTVADPKGKS